MGRFFLSALLSLALGACADGAVSDAQVAAAHAAVDMQAQLAGTVTPLALQAQGEAATATTPAALAVQASVQAIVPATSAPPASTGAAALIVRWEVTSPQVYAKRYAGIACPGGASGPTIGIGADLGQQTPSDIARDWAGHPDVARLQTASGQVGDAACRAWRARHADIRVPYALAARVFQASTLPRYVRAADRALHRGWSTLPTHAQDANISMGYNRGWAMAGDRNREKRQIRDDCVPRSEVPCNATALRAMCRLWADTVNGKGLCARREDEARHAELAT